MQVKSILLVLAYLKCLLFTTALFFFLTLGYPFTDTWSRGVIDRAMSDSGASREEEGEEEDQSPPLLPIPTGTTP